MTFDDQGVSQHPNHISAHEGTMLLAKMNGIKSVYALETVNIVRKYIGFLDIFATDTTQTIYWMHSPRAAASALLRRLPRKRRRRRKPAKRRRRSA